MLPRLSATLAGDSARTPAATSPAAGPDRRRTTRYMTSTDRRLRPPGAATMRPGVHPENPDRQGLDPKRTGQLVQGHRASRVEGGEEEVVPAHRHAANGGGIVELQVGWTSTLGESPTREPPPGALGGPNLVGRRESARTPSDATNCDWRRWPSPRRWDVGQVGVAFNERCERCQRVRKGPSPNSLHELGIHLIDR